MKENSLASEKKNNSSFPNNLRDELDEKCSITQNDCQHSELHPCVNCITTKFSDLVETCMKNAALQLKRISLSKVNEINGTTQKLK